MQLSRTAVGSFSAFKKNDRKRLKAAGVEVMPFSPVLRIHTISYRNHRKIAVIDGCIGYTGGLNMGKEHLEGDGRLHSVAEHPSAVHGPGGACAAGCIHHRLVSWRASFRTARPRISRQ